MILQIDDWIFDLDLERTMEYSAAEASEHCTCGYCRNFYAAVDEFYPNIRPFLTRFGVDIEAPDEQMPYDLDGKTYYDSVYMVYGRITKVGEKPIALDNILVLPSVNHSGPKPSFSLDVSTVVLPWVLEESLEETLSPANEPSFLKKMWGRLLGKALKNGMNS